MKKSSVFVCAALIAGGLPLEDLKAGCIDYSLWQLEFDVCESDNIAYNQQTCSVWHMSEPVGGGEVLEYIRTFYYTPFYTENWYADRWHCYHV